MKSLAVGIFSLTGIFYKACWLGMEIQKKFRQEIKYSFTRVKQLGLETA